MNDLIPKKIKLIVNKAQDLQISSNIKLPKRQPQKWRVIFKGVVEKMATAKVESDCGCPEWLCEISVTCKNAKDPISLLVTDANNNHAGQVVVSLPLVPPKPTDFADDTQRPPLLMQNLIKSELEPTKKISEPNGFLYYWMWAEEYWSLEEVMRLRTKKSLSKSLHNLSNSALNLFRRKSTSSNQHTPKPVPRSRQQKSHSSSLNPFEDPQILHQQRQQQQANQNYKSNSDTSSSTFNSNYLITQNFISTTPNSPNTNELRPGPGNPFDGFGTAVDISIENSIEKPAPFIPNSNTDGNISNGLSHQTSVGSRDSPSNKKRHGIFNKFRNKKSQSSADLTNMLKETNSKGPILPQSLGKSGGQRLFEKRNDNVNVGATWMMPGAGSDNGRLAAKLMENGGDSMKGMYNRPQSCVVDVNEFGNTPNPMAPSDMTHRPTKSSTIDRHFSFNNYTIGSNNRNVDIKSQFNIPTNKEDMTKRDLIELANAMETKLKSSFERCYELEQELQKLKMDKEESQSELVSVRDELCSLKMRLLESGDTKYLEKSDIYQQQSSKPNGILHY